MLKKVLVVDDDIAIVKMVEFKLKAGGFEVICAFDGQEAMDKILTCKPDIIVADISMPEIDGIELTHRVRNNPETKDTPVIILTSRGEDEQREEARMIGATEFTTKPFAPSKLLSIVKKIAGE